MNPEYYREYFRNEREHWWFRARETILRTQVEGLIESGTIPAKPRILNIGAATGRTSEWLGELGEVTSLEYDADCCQLTREATGLDVIEGSITELPFEADSFDLVCAFDVIEHVADHERGVEEMRRVCRPQGVVFVSVPAFMFLWGEHDDINQHERRYRLKELRALFEGGNGTILAASYFNTALFPAVAGIRILRRKKPAGKENAAPRSDFSRDKSGFFSPLLRRIFAGERHLLRRRVRLPVGVSAMLEWRKSSAPEA